MRKAAIFLLILAMLCAIGANCEEVPELLEPVGVQLDYAPVERGDMFLLNLYQAEVICEIEELYFTVDGEIESINVLYGQEVKKGDVLATLDETSLHESIEDLERQIAFTTEDNAYTNELSEIDIEIAELSLEGITDPALLLEKQADIKAMKTALRQQKELQQIDIEALQSQLAAVQAKLGKNQIVAPFDGQIVYIADNQTGDTLQAYTTLLCISDRTRKKISSEYISEMTLNSSKQMYAMIGSEKYDIEYIVPDFTENLTKALMGITLTSEFTLAEDSDNVQVGDYAAICLATRFVEDTLYIPVNAVFTDSQGKYVYKLVDGNRVRQNITVGNTDSMHYEVTEGLTEGDYVYVKE